MRVAKSDMEAVLSALRVQRAAWFDDNPPTVKEDQILWEEGPFEWAILFPCGGIDEEFGSKVKDVSHLIPEHLYTEPVYSCVLRVFAE